VPNAARLARNEHLFREVNERIRELEETFGERPGASFVCECSLVDCTSRLELDLDEYRAVREHPRRFIVVEDHVDPDYERIVSANDRFTVVEKLGLAGEVAEEEAESDE
jgi:hypothetical protein